MTVKQKKKKWKQVKCEALKTDILLIFGVDVSCDDTRVHSSAICRSCVNKIIHAKDHVYEGTINNARTSAEKSAYMWKAFNPDCPSFECSSCARYARTTIGNKYLPTTPISQSNKAPILSEAPLNLIAPIRTQTYDERHVIALDTADILLPFISVNSPIERTTMV